MINTLIAYNPDSGSPEVITEVYSDASKNIQSVINNFKKRLYDQRVQHGILVTPEKTYFVRDNLKSLQFSHNSFDVNPISTDIILQQLHRHSGVSYILDFQIKLWLEGVSKNWSKYIPDEALPFMLPEMVGGLAEATIEEYSGLIDSTA